MGKEAKTNAMRILERAKVPYTAHEYAHEEGVAVDGVTVAASMGEDPACVFQFTAILLHCIGYGSLWQICLHIDIIHHHRSNPCKWWNQKTRRNHNGTKQDHINNRF